MDQEDLVAVAGRLADALAPGDLDTTLSQITAAAVEVMPDVHYASITVKHADGRLETVAPTDPMLLKLDAAQYRFKQGPCYDAAVDAVHVTSPDLANDPRYPLYAPVATSAGIRAQAGIRLFDAKGAEGALNLYSTQVGDLEDMAVLGQLFAHQAGVAIDYAREIESVREAVESRGVIGQAVGIIMERFRMDDARAFGFLVRLSQERNVKVRVLAAELVATSRSDYQVGQ